MPTNDNHQQSTNEKRREEARNKLASQVRQREVTHRRRKTILISTSVVVAIAIICGGSWFGIHQYNTATTDCKYVADTPQSDPFSQVPDTVNPKLTGAAKKAEEMRVAMKKKVRHVPAPDHRQLKHRSVSGAFDTNFGPLSFTLNRAQAPCNVGGVNYLIGKKYYDNTTCHRVTTAKTLTVLQCGDPTASGMSGPGWTMPDEPLSTAAFAPVPGAQPDPSSGKSAVIYPRGTIAMANAGPDTAGSQMFFVDKDAQLPPLYTAIGTLDHRGLETLDKIIANGVKPAPGEPAPPAGKPVEDGQPKDTVTITRAQTQAPSFLASL